jgi:hypothetical protein
MEVHHHPDLHHKKKNFTEYFLEFLMIFLAVTLGFFAESIRENISNRHKESKYMESLVSDLKSDTSETDLAIKRWKGYNANTDSLLFLLKKDINQQNINEMYALLSRDFFHFNLFKYNNKTIEELKSSGDYRLIKKGWIANEIMSNDLDMKYTLIQEQDVKDLMITSKNIESKIFDFSQLDDKWKYNEELKFVHNNTGETLITNDKQTIDEYFNKLWAFHALAVSHEKLFENEKASAIRLLKDIQHEYKIEN